MATYIENGNANKEIWNMRTQVIESVQGNGDLLSTDRDAQNFSGIEVVGAADVEYKPSGSPYVKVTADSNIHSLITTEIVNGKLMVGTRGSFMTSSRILVECGSEAIVSVYIKGSGNVDLDDIITETLAVEIKGSGDVYASGVSGRLFGTIIGSGDIDCSDLVAKEALLEVAGSGDIKAYCAKKLSAQVFGSGDIRVKGSPKEVTQLAQGSGSIKIK